MIYFAYKDHDGMWMFVRIEREWSQHTEFMHWLEFKDDSNLYPYQAMKHLVHFNLDMLEMERGYDFFPRLNSGTDE